MLKRSTIEQSIHIADTLNYTNKRLSVVPGSPLGNIITTLSSFNEVGGIDELQRQSEVAGSTTGTHTEVENYTAHKISNVLANILDTAKNVVNPHCRAIVAGVEEERKEKALSSVGLLGNIKQIELPAVLADNMFIELIEPYKTTPSSVFKNTYEVFNNFIKDLSTEELNILIKTGSATLDNKVSLYITSPISELDFNWYEIDIAALPLRKVVTIFLFLHGIYTQKTDKATTLMSSATNTAVVAKILASAGGRIYRDTALFDKVIKNGDIIARGNLISDYADRNTLYVYGVNYRNWIQTKGGSPEAALGYLALNGNAFTNDLNNTLINNPERYRDEYQSRLNQLKTLSIVEDINLARRFTADYMTDIIRRMENVDKIALHAKLAAALEHEYHGSKYLISYVIKVVSRTLTDGHDVKDILLEIDNVLEELEKPDLDYAIYIATIRLVARWLKNQVVITN